MAVFRYMGGLCLFCILLISALAQQRTFNGVVTNVDDHPVTEEMVKIRDGGTYKTSASGEFTFPDPENMNVNSEVFFHVNNWIIVKPCELRNGRTYLPPPGPDIDIIVVGPSDPRLHVLAYAQGLMGCTVEEAVSRFDISLNRSDAAHILKSTSDQEKFLATKADELGVSRDDLKSALSRWLMMPHDDNYDQGLAELYSGQFSKAKDLIGGSISSPDGQVVLKRYVPLARAKYELGDLEGAKADLNRVLDVHPKDSIVTKDVQIVSAPPAARGAVLSGGTLQGGTIQ